MDHPGDSRKDVDGGEAEHGHCRSLRSLDHRSHHRKRHHLMECCMNSAVLLLMIILSSRHYCLQQLYCSASSIGDNSNANAAANNLTAKSSTMEVLITDGNQAPTESALSTGSSVSPPTSAAVGVASDRLDFDRQATGSDADEPISSSEILNDNGQFAVRQPPAAVADNQSYVPTTGKGIGQALTNVVEQQFVMPLGNKQVPGELSSSSSTTTSSSSPAMSDAEMAAAADVIGSRMLLQMIVLTLLGLVSLSLIVVYGIKFWLCKSRRRKRLLLRRALVSDLAACVSNGSIGASDANTMTAAMALINNTHNGCLDMPLNECVCVTSGAANSMSGGLANTTNNNNGPVLPPCHNTLLAHHQTHQSPWLSALANVPGAEEAWRAAQQQQQQQLQLNWHNHLPPYGSQANQQHQQQPPPPPAYSDLYGAGGQCSSGSGTQAPGAPGGATTCSGGGGAQAPQQQQPQQQQQQQQQQVNLLLRLNLDRTRLLSANDLMLLSKLIDAPVAVLQQQQLQLQHARPTGEPQPSSSAHLDSSLDEASDNDSKCEGQVSTQATTSRRATDGLRSQRRRRRTGRRGSS